MKKKLIICLPVAGIENPYQKLMMEGLNESEQLCAMSGIDDRFFGIIRSAFKYKPEYIHFDWIVSYYYRRWKWLTWLSVPCFFLQIWIVKHLLSIRIVWTLHNISPHDLGSQRLHQLCQKFMARKCDWIRVFGKDTFQKAIQQLNVSEDSIRIIPEGDYTRWYSNTKTRKESRTFLDISEHLKVFLYIGFIRPYKGIAELISVFAQNSDSSNLLIIAGQVKDKAYANELFAKSYPNIRIVPGFIPSGTLQYYFNATDLVVLPFSKIDNSGSVIMSMGFCKPIIAPHSGALIERLEQQSELLFKSPDELSEKINYAHTLSQKTLDNIGMKNREALKKHNWTDFQKSFS